MESRSSPHLAPRHPGSRRLSGTHWKSMQGAARVSLPRQRQPVPLFHKEFAQHPPLVCRPSPPQGGRSVVAMPALFLSPWRLAHSCPRVISPLEGGEERLASGQGKANHLAFPAMNARSRSGAQPGKAEGGAAPRFKVELSRPTVIRARGEEVKMTDGR